MPHWSCWEDQRLSAKGNIFLKNCNMSKTSERGSINPLSLPLHHTNFYCKFLQLYWAKYLCKRLTYHFPNFSKLASLLIFRPSFQWRWRIFSNSSVICQSCKKTLEGCTEERCFYVSAQRKDRHVQYLAITWSCERFVGQCRAKTILSLLFQDPEHCFRPVISHVF